MTRTLAAAAVALAVCWWLWYRPLPTLYVAVAAPQVEDGLPAGQVRMAITADLAQLRQVYPLRADEVDAAGDDPAAIAAAVGVGEVITTRVVPATGDSCRVEVTRRRSSGKETTIRVDVAPVSAAEISRVAADTVLELYSDRRRPWAKASGADYTTYSEICRYASQPGASYIKVLDDLAALRRSDDCPVAAIGYEISVARYLYETTSDTKYLDHAHQVLDEAPSRPEITVAAIELAIIEGQLDRAENLLDQVPTDHPDRWWYHRWIYEAAGSPERAIEVIEAALYNRESWYMYLALARAEKQADRISNAIKSFEVALEMVPGNTVVIEELAVIELLSGEPSRARELYLQVMTKGGDYNPRHLVNLALSNMFLGQYHDAAISLEHTQSRSPGYELTKVQLHIAEAYYLAGESEKAVEAFGKLLDMTDGVSDPRLVSYRAEAQACLGQSADARSNIEYALSKDSSASVTFTASLVYAVLGDTDRATELARQSSRGRVWFSLPWFDGLDLEVAR
jgi:tetratricopeptide (TPR) repeat protein